MSNGGVSVGDWLGKNVWSPLGEYEYDPHWADAYQEWVDEGIAKLVPESKENIDISDRAAGALAGLLIVPLSIPAAVLSTLGCDFGNDKDIDVSEVDIYVPPPKKNKQEDVEVKTETASLGMCNCVTSPQYFDCLEATCGISSTPVTAKDIASCLNEDIGASEPMQITIGLDYKANADTCYGEPKLSAFVKGKLAYEFSFPCSSFGASSLVFCVPAGTALSDITLELTSGDWCSSVLFTSIATANDPSCMPQCIDNDKDGYGENCALGKDCNDSDPQINPGAPEICNNTKDDNCNDKIDEDCPVLCIDNDKDGYGENCALGKDCNDSDPQINPGAPELCNNKDDNCNGQKDEGYNIGVACEAGVGLCINSGKNICSPSGLDVVCDAKPLSSKTEIACDGKDQDCGGSDFLGTDKDGDGYKIEGGACGAVDCNDSNPQINPGALELCNNIDDDCDGKIDEDYKIGGSCTVGVGACANTGVYVCSPDGLETVCNVTPLKPQKEIPCDGVDQDCDGSDYLGTDLDGDGYTAEGGLCGIADCDDNNANIHPATLSEAEMGLANDGIDNNCDGFVDEIDVNGGELTLSNTSGYHGYIHIYNNGKLKLTDSLTSWQTGDLTIDVGSVLDISGVVCGNGDGGPGSGDADGGGGCGASHVQPGGLGGNGGWAGVGCKWGATTYGSIADFSTESGSCGGKGGGNSWAPGGSGGGAISISANNAFIYGAIYADGTDGIDASWDDGGAGGSSGGGIFASANNIYVDTSTTKLTVRGGNGGNGGSYSESGGGGGGGGAGGTIELSFSSAIVQGAIYEIYGSEPCCGFVNRLLEYDIAQTDGGLGGSYGCGAKKCGQPGGNGGYGTVKSP